MQAVDLQLLDYLGTNEIPVLIVLTKIDKLNRSGRARAIADVRKALEPIRPEHTTEDTYRRIEAFREQFDRT